MVNRKEIQEAKRVAHEVLDLLDKVEKELRSARGWGIWDIMRGGFFTSLIKHRRIDRAEALLGRVRDQLGQLQKELGDVNLGLDPSINITAFQRFMDIALDNAISDWFVQSEIKASLKQVRTVHNEVQRVLSTLEQIEQKYGK